MNFKTVIPGVLLSTFVIAGGIADASAAERRRGGDDDGIKSGETRRDRGERGDRNRPADKPVVVKPEPSKPVVVVKPDPKPHYRVEHHADRRGHDDGPRYNRWNEPRRYGWWKRRWAADHHDDRPRRRYSFRFWF